MDLERLMRMSKPIRVAVAEANGRADKVELVDEDSQLSVPKELFRVVDFLWLHGLNVVSSWSDEVYYTVHMTLFYPL